jgi:AraC-like DNA-binding protein
MIPACPPRFEKHNLYRIKQLDRATEFLASCGFGFEVPAAEKHVVDLRFNCACLGTTAVIFMQTGSLATITHQEDDLFWVLLPIREAMAATVGTGEVILGPERAAVTSPTLGFSLKTIGNGSNFAVGIRKPALRHRLAGLLGDDPSEPLEFAPTIELRTGRGNRFARHMVHMVGDFFDAGPIFENPLSAGSFQDFMINELLLWQRHNYSDRLRRADCRIAARDMRRATEFIEAHLDVPISISEVASASGVAGRTLYKHFQDLHGTSPMRYVRERRIERARQALVHADPDASVTDIATQWGFTHLGRFAVEYRKRFSEKPSETLRQRRPAS